jgi:hypothetical protein
MSATPPPRGASAVAFVPHSPELEPGIDAFNARLDAQGVQPEYRLTPASGPMRLRDQSRGLHEERFYAAEGLVVRGGVLLQVQPFWVRGEVQTVANAQLPLSEGIVNREYAYVGMWLMKHVLRRYSYCFAIGMGGVERPLPQLLSAMTWSVQPIPFFFRLIDVTRALRELPALGSTARRRLVGALAAVTGVGRISAVSWAAAAAVSTRGTPRLEACEVGEWGSWADEVWACARSVYDVIGVRDSATLHALYPPEDDHIRCFELRKGAASVGWAALSVRQMVDSPYFGNLRVGTVMDCLCVPGHEVATVCAATQLLAERGADVVVTNQSNRVWQDAFRRGGFLTRQSNYALAVSPRLVRAAPSLEEGVAGVHFTRGDGDGRIHL